MRYFVNYGLVSGSDYCMVDFLRLVLKIMRMKRRLTEQLFRRHRNEPRHMALDCRVDRNCQWVVATGDLW